MRILRVHYYDKPSTLDCQGDTVDVRSYQIIVWVSLGQGLRPFPAILDTGHSHNFSISEEHLERWGGRRPDEFAVIGHIWLKNLRLPQIESDLWLRGDKPFRLKLEEGSHSSGMGHPTNHDFRYSVSGH
jgi:hypothetical protein